MKFKWMAAAAVMLLSVSAGAEGLFVEPGLTYQSGDNKLDWQSPLIPGDSTGSTKGAGFDLKLGVHVSDVLFLAFDGMYSKPHWKNSATDYSADGNSTAYGLVLGAQMPIVGLRLWGGYVFDGTLDPDASGGYNVKFTGANGVKIGAGFHVLMLSLNLEYMDLTYKNSYLEQAGPLTPNTAFDGKYTDKVTVVSVSLPIAL